MPYTVSSFDHTADKGIIVRADSLPALFAGAAVGMFSSMYDLDGVQPDRHREVAVQGTDPEALLVAWLQELIFLFEVQDEVYVAAELHEVSGTKARGTVHGRAIGPEVTQIGAAVKAVTYHELSLEQTADGWEATLLFDV
jgi:SHS2 domain-containing protein